MSQTHEQIMSEIQTYSEENGKFTEKGVKASATRARKKLARFKKSRKPLKGRVNKRRYTVDSDWKEYFGSSDELNADIKKFGKSKFKRVILFYCKSKAELSYIEAREQFARKVLESDQYYNGHIRVRVHGKGILKEKAST